SRSRGAVHRRGGTFRSPGSQDLQLRQLGDGLEERAAADRDELLSTDPSELLGTGFAVAPAESLRRQRDVAHERVLVRERARGEDVQETVPLDSCERVVQAGGRLERNTCVA